MCSGNGTPGNRTTGRGKSGSSCWPRTLSVASLIWKEGLCQSIEQKNSGPRIRVGQRQRGPSSTPSDEEGFTYGVWTDAKGSGRPDLTEIKESVRTTRAGAREL